MKPVGTKSIFLLLFLALSTMAGFQFQKLDIDKIQHLSYEAWFTISFFTVVVGTWFYAFFRLGSKSKSHIRFLGPSQKYPSDVPLVEIGKLAIYSGQSTNPTELPAFAMRVLSLTLAFSLGILGFDSRTVNFMMDTPRKIANVNQYCPDEITVSKQKPPQPKQGCELVKRAYELGLVKDLGTCVDKEIDKKMDLCTLRQRDEPALHFLARQLSSVYSKNKFNVSDSNFHSRMSAAFRRQLGFFNALSGKLRNVVNSAPKASHHIFTDLKSPDGRSMHRNCLSKYQKLSHIFSVGDDDPKANSRILEHIYGQMLFNPQYDEMAGLCQEYDIHWNSPPDSCDQLVRNPMGFLSEYGAISDVTLVLNRIEEERELMRLRVQLKSIETGQPPPLPPTASVIMANLLRPRAYPTATTVVSFQCLMSSAGAASDKPRMVYFSLMGKQFQAREIKFKLERPADSLHADMYRSFAKTMVDDFHYATARSHWNVNENSFSHSDYPLTQLEYLKGMDIFASNDWIQTRSDLLEVYPYYHHLYYFVELFREQYRMQRTRL